jgi:T-complex protein 1 subunit beta
MGEDSKIMITNDGATILKSIHVNNPAAKILIEISKVQDDVVGDGTTTVAVLAGELLRQAERLVQMKIHPQIIIEGFRMARDAARRKLLSIAMDNSEDKEKFKDDLMHVAMTTLSSKLVFHEKECFAKLAVDAVMRLKGSNNLDCIKIIKKPGGSLRESYLDEGYVLEKAISVGCPRRKENPRILVANTPMDYDKIKIQGGKVKVDSMDKVAEIEAAEKAKMKAKVDKILAHKPDVFINRQLIYNYPEQLLAEKGVMVIEHADFDGTERLSAVLGADIASTFDTPASTKLGSCKLVEEIMIGEDRFIKFSGCQANEACTIVLRGSGLHILDEAERSLHDAICVLSQTIINKKTIFGGGNSEIQMAIDVEILAKTVKTKEGLAIEAFAQALKALPTIIADNGGYDSSLLVQILLGELHEGKTAAGLDMQKGLVGDMKVLGRTVGTHHN